MRYVQRGPRVALGVPVRTQDRAARRTVRERLLPPANQGHAARAQDRRVRRLHQVHADRDGRARRSRAGAEPAVQLARRQVERRERVQPRLVGGIPRDARRPRPLGAARGDAQPRDLAGVRRGVVERCGGRKAHGDQFVLGVAPTVGTSSTSHTAVSPKALTTSQNDPSGGSSLSLASICWDVGPGGTGSLRRS